MKEFVIPVYIQLLAWLSAAIIVGLNANLIYDQIMEWMHTSESFIIWLTVVPVTVAAAILLLYITFKPVVKKHILKIPKVPHEAMKHIKEIKIESYKRIAITIDFSTIDNRAISHAITQGGQEAAYQLIHIVESAGALVMGSDIKDFETGSDVQNLQKYCDELKEKGYRCEIKLGYGNPKKAIPEAVKEFNADLLVMGAHGHHWMKDFIFGTTVNTVRHRVNIPVLIVR